MKKKRIVVAFVILILGGIGIMFGLKKDSVPQIGTIQKIEERLSIKLDGLVSSVQVQEVKEYGEEHITAKLLISQEKRKELEKEVS